MLPRPVGVLVATIVKRSRPINASSLTKPFVTSPPLFVLGALALPRLDSSTKKPHQTSKTFYTTTTDNQTELIHEAVSKPDSLETSLRHALRNHDLPNIHITYTTLVSQSPQILAHWSRDYFQNILFHLRKSPDLTHVSLVRHIIEEDMPKLANLEPTGREYNSLIIAFGVAGQTDKISAVIDSMREQGLNIDFFTYAAQFAAFASNNDIPKAEKVMEDMAAKDIKRDYGIFHRAILMYRRRRRLRDVVKLYYEMGHEGLKLDARTYSLLFSTFSQVDPVERAPFLDSLEALRAQALLDVDCFDTIAYNALITNLSLDLPASNTALLQIFDLLHRMRSSNKSDTAPDTYTLNAVLSACVHANKHRMAFTVFRDMTSSGIKPDAITYGILVRGLVEQEDFQGASSLLEEMKDHDLVLTERSLARLIGVTEKNRDRQGKYNRELSELELEAESFATKTEDMTFTLHEGKNTNKDTEEKDMPISIISCNAMMSIYAHLGEKDEAQKFFDAMKQSSIKPDVRTYTWLVIAYIRAGDVNSAMSLYASLKSKSKKSNLIRVSSPYDNISPPTKPSSPSSSSSPPLSSEAGKNESPPIVLNTAFYSAVISALTHASTNTPVSDQLSIAMTLFVDLHRARLQADSAIYTSLLYGYTRTHDINGLSHIHTLLRMDLNLDPDTRVYNALMEGYNRCGHIREVLRVWESLVITSGSLDTSPMKISNISGPNAVSLMTVLDACAHHGMYKRGIEIWSWAIQSGIKPDRNIFASWIRLLCKSGEIDEGLRVAREDMRYGKVNVMDVYDDTNIPLNILSKEEYPPVPDLDIVLVLLESARRHENIEAERNVIEWCRTEWPGIWEKVEERFKTEKSGPSI